jgi:hypothetical protein
MAGAKIKIYWIAGIMEYWNTGTEQNEFAGGKRVLRARERNEIVAGPPSLPPSSRGSGLRRSEKTMAASNTGNEEPESRRFCRDEGDELDETPRTGGESIMRCVNN